MPNIITALIISSSIDRHRKQTIVVAVVGALPVAVDDIGSRPHDVP
jgi:hypothetical protein